jgi:DHA1 family multidrug resistance protein-like MFS transporter
MRLEHPLLIICLAQLCESMGMNLVNPIMPLYASSFNMSYTMVGVVLSSFGITRLFIEVPGGLLTDKLGRKRILLLGYFLSVTAHLVAGFAQAPMELVFSRMVMGIGSALSLTASMTYVLDIAPDVKRARYIAVFQSTNSISGIVGPTLGGLISEGFGLRSLFLVSAIVSTMGMIFALMMRRPAAASGIAVSSRRSITLQEVFDLKIIVISISCFMMFFLFNSIRSTMIPLYGSNELGLSSLQIGLVFSFTSAIIVCCMLLVNVKLENAFRKASLLTLSLLICASSVVLLSFSVDFATLLLFSLPLGFGLSLLQPTPFAMISDYAKPENRGLTLGLARTIADVGIILGSILVGWLIDVGQPLLVFYLISAVLALFSCVTWYVFRDQPASANA